MIENKALSVEKKVLIEKGVLEMLLSAAWHYAHRGQTVFDAFDDVQRSALVKVMELTSKSLPDGYHAQEFIGDLVGRQRPWYEREQILKEYFNKAWQVFLNRKYGIRATVPS